MCACINLKDLGSIEIQILIKQKWSKPGKLHRITHLNAQITVQEVENVIVEENPEGVYNTM